jgi:hypothetical protein
VLIDTDKLKPRLHHDKERNVWVFAWKSTTNAKGISYVDEDDMVDVTDQLNAVTHGLSAYIAELEQIMIVQQRRLFALEGKEWTEDSAIDYLREVDKVANPDAIKRRQLSMVRLRGFDIWSVVANAPVQY